MRLTDEQREVVAIKDGKHLVLAPPGSGETEMLSQRIFAALEGGVDPKRMLCATFTNRAAYEMRERVENSGGELTLPDVGNLHHFAHKFLKSVHILHPKKHVLDEVEQFEFLKECVEKYRREEELSEGAGMLESFMAKAWDKDKSPYPELLSAVLVSHQRRIGFTQEETRHIPKPTIELAKAGVVRELEARYTKLKCEFQAFDFDDLINETCLYLRRHPLPEEKKYLWVQLDEVQDLSPLQWEIVRSLTAESAVSVYFGDMEQAIFSFLGANQTRFLKEIEGCETHYFKTNFRATPKLLDLMTRYSVEVLKTKLPFLPRPADPNKKNGRIAIYGSTDFELVISEVAALLESGTAENVAILVRENAQADFYEEAIRRLHYRYVKVSGRDLFSFPPMRDFLAFVSLMGDKETAGSWQTLFRRFSKSLPNSTSARYFVRRLLSSGVDPKADLERRWGLMPFGPQSDLRRALKASYAKWHGKIKVKIPFRKLFKDFVALALPKGGTLYDLKEPRKRVLERIEAFLRFADKNSITFEDWNMLTKLKEADLLVGDEKIIISTIHKAKGRQFDAVVVPEASLLMYPPGPQEDPDESLRLMYVAISRAKRHLSVFGTNGTWFEKEGEANFS